MRKAKFYIIDGRPMEECYRLDMLLEYHAKEGDTLIEMEQDKGSGFFFCTTFFDCYESGDGCGKDCVGYNPRNGKSGYCKNARIPYRPTDRKFLLKNGKLEPIEKILTNKAQ
ncbi:MAG TPA: hypothetical protein VHO03_16685 [Ignavibacteriales bacterium]|nr:hypothetical protein [Ignavibacteriales bacterium]